MADIQHSALQSADCHEPKGITDLIGGAADAGKVILATGIGTSEIRRLSFSELDTSGGGSTIIGVLSCREQFPHNTAGGATSGGIFNTRFLNTLGTNTIVGAALNTSTYRLTLPAGTYYASAGSSMYKGSLAFLRLHGGVSGTEYLRGPNTGYGPFPFITNTPDPIVTMNGVFVLASTQTDVQLELFVETGDASGHGYPVASESGVEVYANLTILKLG